MYTQYCAELEASLCIFVSTVECRYFLEEGAAVNLFPKLLEFVVASRHCPEGFPAYSAVLPISVNL